MNEKSTKKNLVSRTDWHRLKHKSDDDIDYSDIPETSVSFWDDAEVFMPKHKLHLSLRLDEDVVDYFKHQGRGYQSRINGVLKAYIHAQTREQRH